MQRSFPRIVLAILVILTVATTTFAQTAKLVHTSSIPHNDRFQTIEENGFLESSIEAQEYLNSYMVRYPELSEHWNGRLLVAITGRPVSHLFYWWQNAYDQIGKEAVENGFAFAMIQTVFVDDRATAFSLNKSFIEFSKRNITNAYGTAPEKTYAFGVSRGGSEVRRLAESDESIIDGGLILSAGGGDLPGWLERLARVVRQWPEVDPKVNGDLEDSDPRVQAYAKSVGTPVAARGRWELLAAQLRISALRSEVGTLGLTGLEDEDLLSFDLESYSGNKDFVANVKNATAMGSLKIPLLELVGTHDDVVLADVLTYGDRVKRVAAVSGNDFYRLYQIDGMWHMGFEPGFWFTRGQEYRNLLRDALAQLDRWSSEDVAPEPSGILSPEEVDSYDQIEIERLTAMHPLVLKDLPVTSEFESVLKATRQSAAQLQSVEIGTQHLLLGLLNHEESADLLGKQGLTMYAIEDRVTPGIRRAWDVDFKSMMAQVVTVETANPIDGQTRHEGTIFSQSVEALTLLVDGAPRIIPVVQAVGEMTFRIGDDDNPFRTAAASNFENMERTFFSTTWYITTVHPVDGATGHLIDLVRMNKDHVEGLVNGMPRLLSYADIEKVELIDKGDGVVFWRPPGADYRWNNDLKQIFRVAIEEARLDDAVKVDADHLLRALSKVRKGEAEPFLDEYGITYAIVNPAVQ